MKTIEQLAREAGWTSYDSLDERHQRFHDLAIAQYREGLLDGSGEPVAWLGKHGHMQGNHECLSKRHADQYNVSPDWTRLYTADQMAAAVLREGERCAKVCDAVRARDNALRAADEKAHAAIAKVTGEQDE